MGGSIQPTTERKKSTTGHRTVGKSEAGIFAFTAASASASCRLVSSTWPRGFRYHRFEMRSWGISKPGGLNVHAWLCNM